MRRALDPALTLAEQTGRYLELDAADTLHSLNLDGASGAGRFDETVGNLLRGLCFDGRGVRVYGEMVGLLWTRGDLVQALALEDLWNDLRSRLDFKLLCGYSAADPWATGPAYAQICLRHHTVSRVG